MEHLIDALAGLLAVISSQFSNEDFSAGSRGIGMQYSGPHELEPAIGPLLRIGFPTDWVDSEKYDFDWQVLRNQPDRFHKIDYNAIVV